jgi:hypothetical protein
MRKALGWLLVAITVVVGGQVASPAGPASAEVEVVTDTASNQFPDGIRFDFFFSSTSPVTDVRLRFRILPDGVSATVRPECTEGRVMNCQAVVGNVGATYMVPGAEIVYSWQVTDEEGERFQSDEVTVVYEDKRFQWDSVTDGNLTVYYYFGDESSAQSVLSVANETIDRFTALLDTTLDFPVKIWVYETARDMAPAVASRRGQGDNGSIQTLGEVGASDTALVSRDTEFLDIVRHELTHVVTGAATRGHITDIPTWINEGLSTYSQRNLLPNEGQALGTAIQRNTVLPITSLGVSARGTGNVVSLFYAQSGSIVAFMVDVLGEDKFADFIAAMKNDTTEGALMTVYGLDLLGLENAWREAVGLPEVDLSAPPTPSSQNNQSADPTATPRPQAQNNSNNQNSGGNNSSNAAGGSGDGISTVVLVLIALSVALVGLLCTAAFLALQGRKRGAG